MPLPVRMMTFAFPATFVERFDDRASRSLIHRITFRGAIERYLGDSLAEIIEKDGRLFGQCRYFCHDPTTRNTGAER